MKAAVEGLEQAAVQLQCRMLRLPAVAQQCGRRQRRELKEFTEEIFNRHG